MATYGIDLGTTNSCIARVDKTLRPVVLKSFQGEDTTPSVVYFESARRVVVGRQAKNSALLVPKLVRELVKRDMGQDVRYEYHGQYFTPESVSALILRALAIPAQEQTSEPVEDVVITVPAYFGLQEREATRRAGQIAGLNVLDVLPEPVAAALSCGGVPPPRPPLLRPKGRGPPPPGRADRRVERAGRAARAGGRRAVVSVDQRGHGNPAHLRLRPRRRDVRHHGHAARGR